jgi:hypothetical protein
MSPPWSSKWSFTPLNTATAPGVELDHQKLTNEFFFVVCHHQCHANDGYRRQLPLRTPLSNRLAAAASDPRDSASNGAQVGA